MRVIKDSDLEQVLEQHPKWLETRWDDEIKGDRADLSDAYLSDADLSDANLSDADLSDANLSDADLSDANLSGANLSHANLSGANLSHADLSRADLSRADLSGANLSHADLSRADLSRADLSGANLSGANLSDANLQSVFGDLIAKCFFQPNEVAGLKALLIAGQIDGLAYAGDCACFVGSLEKLAGEQCLVPRDASSPVERWFLAIEKGDTPENNPIVKLTVEWLDSFLSAAARLSD